MTNSFGFNPDDYFKPTGTGYDLTASAAIWSASNNAVDPSFSRSDRRRYRTLVAKTLALFRKARYPAFDQLEAMLMTGQSKAAVALPLLREACDLVGVEVVIPIIRRELKLRS